MNLIAQIGRISDKLAYNLINAPDYPDEDETSLHREEQVLRNWLHEAMTVAKREDIGDWLRLAEQAIIQAFEYFRNGDELAGSRAIQTAEEYLGNASSRKQFKIDFVARPDGTIEGA